MNQPTSPPDASPPGANVRGIVSLLILIHLFMVAVAMSGNLAPSRAQERLLGLFSPYLQPLNLKLSDVFSHKLYHYTGDDPTSFDHFVEVEFQGGSRDGEVIRLPDGQWRGTPNRNRVQALTHMLGFYAENQQDELLGRFVQAIGSHYLAGNAGAEVIVRVRRHLPVPVSSTEASLQQPLDPDAEVYFQTLYQARVWLDANGQSNLVKLDASGQVAPLRGGEGDDDE